MRLQRGHPKPEERARCTRAPHKGAAPKKNRRAGRGAAIILSLGSVVSFGGTRGIGSP